MTQTHYGNALGTNSNLRPKKPPELRRCKGCPILVVVCASHAGAHVDKCPELQKLGLWAKGSTQPQLPCHPRSEQSRVDAAVAFLDNCATVLQMFSRCAMSGHVAFESIKRFCIPQFHQTCFLSIKTLDSNTTPPLKSAPP